MSFGRAEEKTLSAADNSPHFPFSAAAGAHNLCSSIPCPVSSQTRIAPSNDMFANRALQQINKHTWALHVWPVRHLEPLIFNRLLLLWEELWHKPTSSVSGAAAPASFPQTVPWLPWVPWHPGSDKTCAAQGVTTLTKGTGSLTSRLERSSWGGTGTAGFLRLHFCFKQLNLVLPTPEKSPLKMNETSHINELRVSLQCY